MRQLSPTPAEIFAAYHAGLDFNNAIDLYRSVETNENFFIGKQWEGVRSNGLPTPVFNFLKRAVLFSVANVSSGMLKLHAEHLHVAGQRSKAAMEILSDVLNDQFEAIFEDNAMSARIREFARNAAVDGDGCTYTYWDPDAHGTGNGTGAIRTEVLQNTQVVFGNPNCREVQSQPYLIIDRRVPVAEAVRRAMRFGASRTEAEEAITPDDRESADDRRLDMAGGAKVTVLVYLWRDTESGTIHAVECTRNFCLRRVWDLGLRLYPVTWMNWDYVQNCYHGQAMVTGLIPNQIFVNKLFAMSMISLMTLAYPKVVYDRTRLEHWDNRVGAAIGVSGGVDGVAKIIDPAAVSPQIAQFISLAVSYTQKFLGATDAALGDVRPENTSAIIALQRAAATPMELTQQNLLQSVEDLGRIYMEFMGAYYGERLIQIRNPIDREELVIPFDFSALQDIPFQIRLDVGASSYWSEIANQQTLDNLLTQNKISTADYLERLPAGTITDRESLIAALKRTQKPGNPEYATADEAGTAGSRPGM